MYRDKPCGVCGEIFTPTGGAAVFCSDICRKARKAAKAAVVNAKIRLDNVGRAWVFVPMSERPIKPEPKTCECGEAAAIRWVGRPTTGNPRWACLRRCARCNHLSSKYKMTLVEFDAMLSAQGGTCALSWCDNPATDIDHDHNCCPGSFTCGKCVRGILCMWHNVHGMVMIDQLVKHRGFTEVMEYVGVPYV